MKLYFQLIGTIIFLPLIISSARTPSPHTAVSKGVLLSYLGTMKSPQMSFDIGVDFSMDPAIGIRYEVVYEKGDNVLSHIAIFYKFSQPNHTTLYNYLTHKTIVNNKGGGVAGSPDVVVIGKEVMDKYSCTHLQYAHKNPESVSQDDYWMAQKLPGFQSVTKALNQINSGAGSFFINGSVFNWGGLVKWKRFDEDKKSGKKVVMELHLTEANPAMEFSATTFEVPKK